MINPQAKKALIAVVAKLGREEGKTEISDQLRKERNPVQTTLHPAPKPEQKLKGSTCEHGWCNEQHDQQPSSVDFHTQLDSRDPQQGVLRHDFNLEGQTASIVVAESFEWCIPIEQSARYFAMLRAEIDHLESVANKFITQMQVMSLA